MGGDPNLLFEAVGNLVDNALKFPRAVAASRCAAFAAKPRSASRSSIPAPAFRAIPMTRCCGDFIARKRAGTRTEVV
jgi:hypothetical protein